MIKSKEDYLFYIKADRLALKIIKLIIFPNHIWSFQKSLRKAEYYQNYQKSIFDRFIFAYIKYRRLSLKLRFSIPLNVFDLGLSIAHYGTIVINGAVRIGAKLYGNIEIEDNIAIGANTLLNKSFIIDSVFIAGIPTKEISPSNIKQLLVFVKEGVKKNVVLMTPLSTELLNKKIGGKKS